MNANGTEKRQLKGAIAFALLAALLLSGVAYAAESSVTLDHFIIDLVSVTSSNGSANWVYAVSTNPLNLPEPGGGEGLSHWELAVDSDCYTLTAPDPDQNPLYETPVEGFGCSPDGPYQCTAGVYVVEHDATKKLLKYEFQSGTPLDADNPGTHIFTFTLSYEDNAYVGGTSVSVKFGGTELTGEIKGPICGPSAVTLTGMSVDNSNRDGLMTVGLALFGGLGLITLAGFFTLRRDNR